MKIIKKNTSILLMAAMLVSLLGVTTFAATSDYTIKDGTLTAYTGTEKDLLIPSNLGIKSIAMYAFANSETVTSVTVPANVENIDSRAFAWNWKLTSIKVADGNANYSSVDGVLFSKDKKQLVTYPCGREGAYSIPSGVTEIMMMAFVNAPELTAVTIPEGVKTVREYAFSGCQRLSSVTVPASVTLLENEAFGQCKALMNISVAGGSANYSSTDGVLYNKDKSVLICFPGGKAGSFKVPASVKTIGNSAFSGNTSLFGVTIPLGITRIESSAFLNCTGLIKAIVSSGVTSIGDDSFGNCPNATLYVAPGSYAETYAKAKSLTYAPISTTAAVTSATVLVNGKNVKFEAYNIGGNNFFKLRDLAKAITGTDRQFEVGFDSSKSAITLTIGKAYTSNGTEFAASSGTASKKAQISTDTVCLNSTEICLKAYKINGSNYFKLRDIAEAIDFSVDYSNKTNTITIDTTAGYAFE